MREAMDVEWAPVERWYLGSSERQVPESVVIKTRRHGESGWGGHPLNLVTERRALSLLSDSGLTPQLYAYDDAQGVIVMGDIRDSVTVEHLLFGDNQAAAVDALVESARTLGAINSTTVGIPSGTWNPEVDTIDDPYGSLVRVNSLLESHEFSRINGVDSDVQAVQTFISDESMRSLTHWDMNPSNALFTDARVVVIDFEGANPSHMALDGASFAKGFPHYRYWAPLPDAVVDAMRDAWIDAVQSRWSDAPDHSDMLQHIAAGAICQTLARMTRLDRIAEPDQSRESALRRRPQIVDNIRRSIRCCEDAGCFVELRESLKQVESEMRDRWSEANHPRIFPAFNGGSREGWTIYHPI